MFILFISAAFTMIGFGVIFPLLPTMQVKFNLSSIELGYISGIFALTNIFGNLFFGYLSDRIGRKKMLYIPFLLSSIVYILFAYANDVYDFLILRALSGFLTGNLAVAFACASDLSTNENKFKNMGIIGAGFGLGFVFGPAIGGFLAGGSLNVNQVDLFLPFLISSIASTISALLIMFYLKESLTLEDRKQNTNYSIIKDLKEFSNNPTMIFFTFLSIFLSLVMSGVEVFLGPWLKDNLSFSPQDIGLYWGIFSIILAISELTTPRFFKPKSAIILGFIIFGLSQFSILLVNNLSILAISTFAMAVSMGLIFPSISVGLSSQGAKNQQGIIFGVNQSVGSIGRMLGPIFLGYIYIIHPNYAWISLGFLSILTALTTIKYFKNN